MNKHIFLSVILQIMMNTVFCQVIESTQLSSVKFDPSGKIYNKHTGKKISEEEFAAYIKDNPRVSFSYEVDKFGQVAKYLLDTTSRSASQLLRTQEMEVGTEFPEFVFKTTEGKKIKSKNLKGKWVVMRFENYLRFDSLAIAKYDAQIQNRDLDEVVYISCLQENKAEVEAVLNEKILSVHLVPDAHFYYLKYNIALNPDALPTTILIDPKGRIREYYYPKDELDWDALRTE